MQALLVDYGGFMKTIEIPTHGTSYAPPDIHWPATVKRRVNYYDPATEFDKLVEFHRVFKKSATLPNGTVVYTEEHPPVI